MFCREMKKRERFFLQKQPYQFGKYKKLVRFWQNGFGKVKFWQS